ncbi:hypothetical protein BOTBODRAFT_36939 [Botryobasidium botryosum FD-172 SS1]|uniref:Uncharacterized protein n=1 Tax=Botryobasidium botryosum (strain FD-172 SS1) TaxID=930990 RepID=A0A067MD65_BOTB1|nr:hypothetical protein BOTBODRAFT_36939 [Botryobasidium botryosum FD-172 SS1]
MEYAGEPCTPGTKWPNAPPRKDRIRPVHRYPMEKDVVMTHEAAKKCVRPVQHNITCLKFRYKLEDS